MLHLPWCLLSKQTGSGPLHLLPAGAVDRQRLPSDRQRRGPRHGGHSAVRQPVEPHADAKETSGQAAVQGMFLIA